jgi:hypothetical protein
MCGDRLALPKLGRIAFANNPSVIERHVEWITHASTTCARARFFVDRRLHYQFHVAYFSVMYPNDLLCMAWKAQRADVSRHAGGDLRGSA